MFYLAHCVLSSICLKLRKISMNPFQLCKLPPPAPQLYFPYLCCHFTVSYFLPKSAKSIWYFFKPGIFRESNTTPSFPNPNTFCIFNFKVAHCLSAFCCLVVYEQQNGLRVTSWCVKRSPRGAMKNVATHSFVTNLTPFPLLHLWKVLWCSLMMIFHQDHYFYYDHLWSMIIFMCIVWFESSAEEFFICRWDGPKYKNLSSMISN